MSRINQRIPIDCVRIIISYLNPRKDSSIVTKILQVSKDLRNSLVDCLVRFHFRVTNVSVLHQKEVRILYVYQLEVNNEILSEGGKFKDSMFKCFPNIQKLIISAPGKSIGNAGFKYLKNLRYLEIDDSHGFMRGKLTIITSDIFRKCKTLEKLYLSQLPLSFSISSNLKKLENLRTLYLRGYFVRDKLFKNIPNKVKELHFFQCGQISDNGIRMTKPTVQIVTLRRCIRVFNGKEILLGINKNMKVEDDEAGKYENLVGGISPPENRTKCNIS